MNIKSQLRGMAKFSLLTTFLILTSTCLYALDTDESAEDQAIESDSDRAIKFTKRKWEVDRKGRFEICPGQFEGSQCVDGYTVPDLHGIPATAVSLKQFLRDEFPDDKFKIEAKTIMPTGELYVFITFKGKK